MHFLLSRSRRCRRKVAFLRPSSRTTNQIKSDARCNPPPESIFALVWSKLPMFLRHSLLASQCNQPMSHGCVLPPNLTDLGNVDAVCDSIGSACNLQCNSFLLEIWRCRVFCDNYKFVLPALTCTSSKAFFASASFAHFFAIRVNDVLDIVCVLVPLKRIPARLPEV